MAYKATCNFDAGKGLVLVGAPYSGPDAEALLQEGLLCLVPDEVPTPSVADVEAEPEPAKAKGKAKKA